MIQNIEKKELINWHYMRILECTKISAVWLKNTNNPVFNEYLNWFKNQCNNLKQDLSTVENTQQKWVLEDIILNKIEQLD